MTNNQSRGIVQRLDDPATWLLAVGCADPFSTDPAIRLHCLHAVEQLRIAGAQPEPVLPPSPAQDVAARLRDAEHRLSTLPAKLLLEWPVFDAVRAVRAALGALG